ncbi:hypothetical protein [Streptococcus equi]|uniref:hypothetical protein n=1 Tax=Streptococcus equi TaxID=1336 RepID=UPI000E080C13|nr:hypothetical protein [Streptococcus equi]SUN53204.1 Uncharacterised protein [Streptococcus equi subsp. zooepidemicus]HEL1022416.1 hypothetical protein [Streptococcus equi subsp. zooepidemicus]
MARKNYFDIIGTIEFNGDRELKHLRDLLEKRKFYRNYRKTSICDVISDNFVYYLNRGTFIDYVQMEEYILSSTSNAIDQLFLLSEFLVDIFDNIWKCFTSEEQRFIEIIKENINRFLDLANHEMIELENGREIIVEKNVYASQVSQIISETNIYESMKVLEYNHFANKGNVECKREILISLARYLEPLRGEVNSSEELKEVLKANNKKIIAIDKLFEMYNQLGLRHNNSKQYHTNMTDEECEQWYDDIYTSTLFVVLSIDEAKILSRLKEIKRDS